VRTRRSERCSTWSGVPRQHDHSDLGIGFGFGEGRIELAKQAAGLGVLVLGPVQRHASDAAGERIVDVLVGH
jgi:hypothetical protein